MGHSRSLEMAPFDRLHTSSYSSSIVHMSLSSTVTEIFSVEYWLDLEIWVRGPNPDFKNLGVVKIIENGADL